MRHSNRRGDFAYSPNRQYPEPLRVQEIRENRNRFLNDSDDYYGRYNRYENDVYDRDRWDVQDYNQFGQQEFEFEGRRNQSNPFDQGQRFSNRRDGINNNDDRYETEWWFQPKRGYAADHAFERSNSPFYENLGYGGAGQHNGRYIGYRNHRGKGPKGYKRSVERIKEDVFDRTP